MKCAKFVGVGFVGAVATLASVSVATNWRAEPAAPAIVPAAVADGAFKVDPVHSSVVFRIKHMNVAYFYGRFDKVEGSFNVDAKDPAKDAVDLTVHTESVDSNNPARDKHLKSPDFFSVTEFPTITFKSSGWKQVGSADGETTYDVTGDLTILGKTKPVVAQVRHTGTGPGMRGGEAAGLEAKLTIKRSDFGMNNMIGKGLSDEVTIMVGLEGGRQ